MYEYIRRVPLIDFLLDLLATYTDTKDNLTEECFSHNTFETKISKAYKYEIETRTDIFSRRLEI